MQRLTRIRILDAMDFIRAEGGCSDIIDLGLRKIADALDAEMDDEDLVIPDDSDDLVVDGPEPKEEQETKEKEEKKRRRNREDAPEIRSLATSPSRVPVLTPEQITTGRAKIMRLIRQRTPQDIPTLVRACIDDGMTANVLAALTGLGYCTIAKSKTGAVTSTVADRFQELFSFPRTQENEEEE